MSIKTKSFKALGLLLMVFVMAGIAWASTDTYDTPYLGTEVVPVCITASGTSDTPSTALVVTVPQGFQPAYLEFYQDYDEANGDIHFKTLRGMPAAAVFSISAAGDPAYVSSGGWTFSGTTNALTIPITMQAHGGAYLLHTCR